MSVKGGEAVLKGAGAQVFGISSTSPLQAGAGCYYVPEFFIGPNFALVASAINTLWALPHIARRTGLVRNFQLRITVSGGVGSLYRIGVYDADQSSLFPTTRLFDSGDQDGTVIGSPVTVTPAVPVQLRAGRLYYVTYAAGVGAPTIAVSIAGTLAFMPFLYGGTIANPFAITGFKASQRSAAGAFAYGVLPNPWPAAFNTQEQGQAATPILTIRYL